MLAFDSLRCSALLYSVGVAAGAGMCRHWAWARGDGGLRSGVNVVAAYGVWIVGLGGWAHVRVCIHVS